MKIKVDPKQLRKLLSELLPFAKLAKDDKDARTVKVKTDNGLLEMYAGDFKNNHYVERTLPVTVLEDGEAGLEIRQTLDVLTTIDTEVELTIGAGQSGSIRSNKTNLPLRGSVDEVMRLYPPDTGWVTIAQTGQLIAAAARAEKGRRQDDGLYYDIDGICILPTDKGTELVCTDKNHLIAVGGITEHCVSEMIVAQPHLAKALSYYNKKEPIELCVQRPCIWIRQHGKLNVVGMLKGDMFHDYHDILDPDPIVLGGMEQVDAQKIVTLIRKKILEPNPLGLITLSGSDNTLTMCGKYKKYQYACDMEGIELERTACNADGLATMLAMFDGIVTLKYSKKEEQLYLTDDNQLAIIRIMKDFLRN